MRPLLISLCSFLLAHAASAQNTVLYSSDFEADDGGFSIGGTSAWEHGVPTSGPGSAHSGTKCWATSLAGEPGSGTHAVHAPLIDASAATGADALLVRWWQWFDEGPSTSYFSDVRAFNGEGELQHVFGRRFDQSAPGPAHVGWREVEVLLGPEFATSTLQVSFSLSTSGEGQYIDDFAVEVIESVLISIDDFETSAGGFHGDPLWDHGQPGGCPQPVAAASGELCWGSNVAGCVYGPFADELLHSPVIDLSPWANRREVYLSWNRTLMFEGADGVHHDISQDGGATWEIFAGRHLAARSEPDYAGWVGFGVPVDPALGTDVQLRFRLTSDSIEAFYGMWLDDFAVSVPELVPGTGANPAESLRVSSGAFDVGSAVELELDDPGGTFAPGSLSLLFVSLSPDANLPDGTTMPGWGMAAPGSDGDLLVDLTRLAGSFVGTPWSPGQPAVVALAVPSLPALAGLDLWLQGLLADTTGTFPRFGLTNGLFERIGS